MCAYGVGDFPIALTLLPSLYIGKPIYLLLPRRVEVPFFEVGNVLRYLRYENFFVISMCFSSSQLYALKFFWLSNWALNYLVFVDIDNDIGPCLLIIQEKLIGRTCHKACVLFEDVKFAETENWNEMAVMIKNMQGKPILPIRQMLPQNRLCSRIFKSQ